MSRPFRARRPRPPRLVALAAMFLLSRCLCGWCKPGEDMCNSECVPESSYQSDPANCGSCGHACPPGAACLSGVCTCPPGREICGAACVDVASYQDDPANCGGCGISCGPGSCSDAVCNCAPFTLCPSQVPRCVDGLTDPQNCGTGAAACGHACPLANAICESGTCACPPGTAACPTACRDLATDEAACGACDVVCATGATCASGTCLCPAEAPEACGGECVDTRTDVRHCGTCGSRCERYATCEAGECACPAHWPLTCPASSPDDWGTCCPGTGCCDNYSGCQTDHSNGWDVPGLGQSYFDCLPWGTYDLTQALKAAQAWQAVGTMVQGSELGCQSQSCVGWRTSDACGVWCYAPAGQPLHGRVVLDTQGPACVCPATGIPNWN